MTFETWGGKGITVRWSPLGVINTNGYVVRCEATGAGAVIDSAASADVLETMLKAPPRADLRVLLQTHAHVDHVAALGAMKARHEVAVAVHPDEEMLWRAATMQGQWLGIDVDPLPDWDRPLADGDHVEVGELIATVLHTPGHTPGSVCYYFEDQKLLFSGDLIFANGGIGRTDLPGGHGPTMRKSLLRVGKLPEEVVVMSGHGPPTTIGAEKLQNRYL